MLLSPNSIETLSSQFYNTDTATYDTNLTLSITTVVYRDRDYKAGRPPVGTFGWNYQPVIGGQILQGLFTCVLPAWAIGPGPNAPGCGFPLTLVTTGIAGDLVTVVFQDVVQAFARPSQTI